ncbi:MAG: hypothetical protein OXN17_11700 [Candidatus Poribacteria bacterium]|nr:hypothetical protein [Candidatus Poribacteria bacterium]MDE0506178.1 hypothetical protein [Candidatus Poribacteria bacterium]
MIRKISCPVLVFFLVTLMLGSNSSAQHVQVEDFAKDAEFTATLEALPERSSGLERPIVRLQHPPITIHPETHTEFRVPLAPSNSNPTKWKILTVTPDPNFDYKIEVKTPDPGTDYKMNIVPNQMQSPPTTWVQGLPHGQVPEFPTAPRKMDEESTARLEALPEQSLGLERPIVRLPHPPITIHPETHSELRVPIVPPNSNLRWKIQTVTPDPNYDYKMAVATPDPGTDYKMIIVPNQMQLPPNTGIQGHPHGQIPKFPTTPRKREYQPRGDAK